MNYLGSFSSLPDISRPLEALVHNEAISEDAPILVNRAFGLRAITNVLFVSIAERRDKTLTLQALTASIKGRFGAEAAHAFEKEAATAQRLTVGVVRNFYIKQEELEATFAAGAEVKKVANPEEILTTLAKEGIGESLTGEKINVEGPEKSTVLLAGPPCSLKKMGYYLPPGESDKVIPTAYLRSLGRKERNALRDMVSYGSRSSLLSAIEGFFSSPRLIINTLSKKINGLSEKLLAEEEVQKSENKVDLLSCEKEKHEATLKEAREELDKLCQGDKTKRLPHFEEQRSRIQGQIEELSCKVAEFEEALHLAVQELVEKREKLDGIFVQIPSEETQMQLDEAQQILSKLKEETQGMKEWPLPKLRAYYDSKNYLTNVLGASLKKAKNTLESLTCLAPEAREENYFEKLGQAQTDVKQAQEKLSKAQKEVSEKFQVGDDEVISYIKIKDFERHEEERKKNTVEGTQHSFATQAAKFLYYKAASGDVDWGRFSLVVNGKRISCTNAQPEENINKIREEISALIKRVPTDEELYKIICLVAKEGRTAGFPTGSHFETGLALETEMVSGNPSLEEMEITLAPDNHSLDFHFKSAEKIYLKGILVPKSDGSLVRYDLSSIGDENTMDRIDRERDKDIPQFETHTQYTYRLSSESFELINSTQAYWPAKFENEEEGTDQEIGEDTSSDAGSLISESSSESSENSSTGYPDNPRVYPDNLA